LWTSYLQPKTVEEALRSLQASAGSKAIIAGGTDLLLDLEQGRHPHVDLLVDVTDIEEMRQIRLDVDRLFLGAAVTHREIVESGTLQEHAACLVDASGLIGGPQVRNIATIGGNVAHALPAADGTIALLALGAEAQIASANGREWRPLGELFAGPGETAFDRTGEILVGFRIPACRRNEGSAFQRIMRPQGVAIAILNMAAWLRETGDGVIQDVRIAVGPAGPRPFRGRKTEAVLLGQRLDKETLHKATASLLEGVSLRTSPHRATSEYRRHLVPVLMERTLKEAQDRARERPG